MTRWVIPAKQPDYSVGGFGHMPNKKAAFRLLCDPAGARTGASEKE